MLPPHIPIGREQQENAAAARRPGESTEAWALRVRDMRPIPDLSADQLAAYERVIGALHRAARGPAPQPLPVGLAGAAAIDNPKLHLADLKPLPRPAGAAWLARGRPAARHRDAGDPRTTTLMQAAQALHALGERDRRGYVRIGLKALAIAAGFGRTKPCIETARRAVRWLQRAELLDAANVIERRWIGGVRRMVRGWNAYVLRGGPAQTPMATGAAEPPSVPRPWTIAYAAGALARCAARWGLAVRGRGLAAPLRGGT